MSRAKQRRSPFRSFGAVAIYRSTQQRVVRACRQLGKHNMFISPQLDAWVIVHDEEFENEEPADRFDLFPKVATDLSHVLQRPIVSFTLSPWVREIVVKHPESGLRRFDWSFPRTDPNAPNDIRKLVAEVATTLNCPMNASVLDMYLLHEAAFPIWYSEGFYSLAHIPNCYSIKNIEYSYSVLYRSHTGVSEAGIEGWSGYVLV